MESNLRPLTLGEILDRTAQLYRTYFLLFAGIFSIYAGVATVIGLLQIGLGAWLKAQHMAGAVIWVTIIGSCIGVLATLLLFGAAIAAISRAVAWVHLGEPATIRSAYLSTLPQLGRYLWLMIITFFKAWSPFVLLYVGFLGTIFYYGGFKGLGASPGTAAPPVGFATNPQAETAIAIAGIAFALLIIPIGVYTILMSLRYALAIPACVVENLKARAAIRRSIELAKKAWGRIFMLGLLIGAIKLMLVGITQAFVFIAAFKNHGQIGPGLTALSQVISFFTTSFLGPIWATGVTLLYYDQRVRKEGYDIEWMMQAAGLTVPKPEPEAAAKLPATALQDSEAAHE